MLFSSQNYFYDSFKFNKAKIHKLIWASKWQFLSLHEVTNLFSCCEKHKELLEWILLRSVKKSSSWSQSMPHEMSSASLSCAKFNSRILWLHIQINNFFIFLLLKRTFQRWHWVMSSSWRWLARRHLPTQLDIVLLHYHHTCTETSPMRDH